MNAVRGKAGRVWANGFWWAVVLSAAGCGRTTDPDPSAATPFTPAPLGDRPGLHNVIRLTARLYSGSTPEGEGGFHSLRDLGVKTVISVDGAKPDVATAARLGLRYVHLPVGYDGIPRESAVKIARAVRDLPGPVYVHCHHGRHRGPAAAAAALRCGDEPCPSETALAFLRTAGTDPKYAGLFASVERSAPATPEEWARAGGEFPDTAAVPDLTRHMVGIDERWDRLKLIRAAGWVAPPGHPALDPSREAVLLSEHFLETNRADAIRTRDEDFRQWMADATEAARDLERALRAVPPRPAEASTAFTRSAGLCAKCHERYRGR